jgi:hypothetical protein
MGVIRVIYGLVMMKCTIGDRFLVASWLRLNVPAPRIHVIRLSGALPAAI